MQEGIGDKLPLVGSAWIEHELLGPETEIFGLARGGLARPVGQNKENDVDDYQCVICVWCTPRANTCTYREDHSLVYLPTGQLALFIRSPIVVAWGVGDKA